MTRAAKDLRIEELEREVQALKAALARASDHERFVDSIVENLPDMVFVKDATELRFVRFNAAGEAMLGRSRTDLIGFNDADFFPAEEAAAFVAKDREVLRSGRVVDIPEEPIHTPSGLRYLHTKKIPIVDEGGKPLYLLGISEDVTERKAAAEVLARRTEDLIQAQAELRAGERRLRLLLQQFPGAMWTTDAELRVRTVAGAGAGPLGLTDAVGELVWEVLPSGGPDVDVERAHRATLAGEPVTYEFHHGGRTSEVRLDRLHEDGEGGVVGVALDVTERRRIDSERLLATLERTQRMETLGVLAGGIAHDFNNLLVAILGNTSLALLRLPEVSPAREGIERATAAAEAASALTRQLLAYSGKGRFVVEPVDLSVLIEGIAGLMRVSLGKNAVLDLRLQPALALCAVDSAQIRQLILNLITNAADAVDGRAGTIRVSTSVVVADREYLSWAWLDEQLPEGRYVCVEVADNGIGMSTDTVNRMFDPFFSTKAKGHGLGMAATLGIVRGHRGAIRVYSEPGKGTTIKVLLPTLADGVERPAVAATPQVGPTRGSCVLVVDDEPAIRRFVCAALATQGYRTMEAGDGVEATEVFAAHSAEIDLVLLDMTMPRMSGEEAFREMRRARPDVRVLLTSGYSEQETATRFGGKGVAGFLEKPYRAVDLFARVATALQRS